MKAPLDDTSYSPASVAADPIVGVDRMLSEVAAMDVVFDEPPASPESPPEVVIDLTTRSDRPLMVVVIENAPPPPPPPPPQRADDVPVMQQAYAGDADRVRYINNDLKTMKVAYTRRWVARPLRRQVNRRPATGPGRQPVRKCRPACNRGLFPLSPARFGEA